MTDSLGDEAPLRHVPHELRRHAKYLVLIDAGGPRVARLFDEQRRELAEFDASLEEVAQMVHGLQPERGADGPQWDRALEGHSRDERQAADVYVLDL